jgi:hypothetical protein
LLPRHLVKCCEPTPRRSKRLSRGFAEGGVIPQAYWRLARRWVIWGTIATLLPLANLYFMVVKSV